MDGEKVALVVAGGSGMAAETARRLADEGFRLGIMSPSGRGEALAATLGGVGVTGSYASLADLERLFDLAMRRWGRIDVLVNGAGHGPKGEILELTDEDWHAALDVYLLHVVRAARLAVPIMVPQGGGAIINISTFAALEPDAAFPTSSVIRAGLAAFTKLFADGYAAQNVRMNNVLPGFVDTRPASAERLRRIPMGRYARTDEIAATIAFLASDEAAYITGQNIRVDGGVMRSL